MNICLLPEKVAEFRQALKDKTINIADLLDMTSEERTALLEKYAGDQAKKVNTLFEEKLVLKNRMLGIKNWASKMGEIGKYSPLGKAELDKALSEYRARQQERIFSPAENEAFLNDLADKRAGVHISREVAAKVFELSAKADALREVNPKMSGVSDEYLKAREELNAYVESQKPVSAGVSIGKNAAIIARNNLLMNPSTPLKTTVGQIVNSGMDMFTRRLATASARGLNGDLVRQANTEAWQTFMKTKLNTASMERLDDSGRLGEGTRFDVSAGMDSSNRFVRAAEATVRKVAQVSNKIAIDWEHNISFTKFYQKAFFDMVNIASTNMAKSEKLLGGQAKTRAAEIFKDAVRIVPETKEGATVRQLAQHQAARVTSTNDTYIGRLSLGVKDALNKTVPGLGDALMPIAKIPANIIWNGIENAGIGIPLGVRDIFKGRAKMQSTDLATRYEGMAQYAEGIQKVIRTFGVLSTAAYFASQLQKSDFKSDRYGGDYVRIGGVWVNMEYVNAISPALAGMMMVKKEGKPGQDLINTAGQYSAGALTGLKNAPGIDELSSLVTAVTNSNYEKGIQKYASSFFTDRGIPSFIRQLSTGVTPIKNLFFSSTGLPTKQELDKLGAQ